MSFLRYVAVVLVASIGTLTHVAAQESTNLGVDYTIIGGGRVSGIYFPAAGALCELFNRESTATRCFVESNTDSFANLRALRNGAIDFAIVQSDWVRQAALGIGPFREEGADEDLRTIFSMHGEALTLLATRASGIRSSGGLANMRVNVGPPGTYQRLLTDWLLQAQNTDHADLAKALELPDTEQMSALCDGRVDAIALVIAHPSSRVAEIAARCGTAVVPVDQRAIEVLLKGRSDLSAITIPSGYYANSPAAIQSFGLRAILVTNERIEAAIVDYMVRSVFGNLDTLRAQHPVFAALDAETMARQRSDAPLHEGALKLFKERGWR